MENNSKPWFLISELMYELENSLQTADATQVDSLIELRNKIRIHIDNVSQLLEAEFNTKTMRFCVFALIVLVDEKLTPFYCKTAVKWVPLQKEIFNTQNGGVEFYEYLDEILVNNFYPKIIYEIYYYVLKNGYRGKLVNETIDKINVYTTRLENLLDEKKETKEAENLVNTTNFIMLTRKQKFYQKINKFFPSFSLLLLILIYFASCFLIYKM